MIRSIPVPPASAAHALLRDATFHDCHEAPLADPGMTAIEAYRAITAGTPGWINALMDLRNALARRAGLKDVGRLGAHAASAGPPRQGDRLDIFRILSIDDDELLVGETDRHLDVRVNVHRFTRGGQAMVAMSTVVHVHNAFGAAYMIGVRPFHHIIVRRLLAGFVSASRARGAAR